MIRIGSFILLTRFVIVRVYAYTIRFWGHSLIPFHASDSIRYDAQIFVAVRTLSPRFVHVR